FVYVPNAIGCEPCRAVPVQPPALSVSINGCQKPVELLWIDVDAVELEHHRRCSHGAAFAAERPVGLDSAQRIVRPFFLRLTERWHSQFNAMEKKATAARRKFSFPTPVDLQSHRRGDEQHSYRNDEWQPALQNIKL